MSQSDEASDPTPTDTLAAPSTQSPVERRLIARVHASMHRHPVTGLIAKIVVTAIGVLVILAGVVMLVAPGPGIVAIILGLAILSTEWTWAERLLTWARHKAAEAAHSARTMDPAVRRRRIILTTAATVAAIALIVGWIAWQGWPHLAVGTWDKVQNISDKVPELPGM